MVLLVQQIDGKVCSLSHSGRLHSIYHSICYSFSVPPVQRAPCSATHRQCNRALWLLLVAGIGSAMVLWLLYRAALPCRLLFAWCCLLHYLSTTGAVASQQPHLLSFCYAQSESVMRRAVLRAESGNPDTDLRVDVTGSCWLPYLVMLPLATWG